MLRRSNSSSHIPGPKNESRARSRSSVRMSGRETGLFGGKSNLKRGSTEKIPALKRSTSSTALRKASHLTPTLQAGSSLKRSTSSLQTPSSSSKSPYRFGSGKSDRNIGDKKWVSEQFIKVKNYLQEHPSCHEHILDSLKPPTINTFVFVAQLLLKEIDGRINFTMANYKEVISNRLKMLRYPGTISNSLLKTVNTMHAWPQVISMFAWLVDLIRTLQRAELPVEPIFESDVKQQKIECVTEYLIDKYIQYNNNEDESIADTMFLEKYANILNIDEEKIERLNREVAELSDFKEKQMRQIRDIQNENDLMKKEIVEMEYEIDTFYAYDEGKQDDIDQTIAYLKQKKIRLIEDIKLKQENIKELNEAIAKQPCTHEKKMQLETRVDQLIHTLDLKKQRFAVKKELKAKCDSKLSEARKKVETEVYRLNNELMQLAIVEPELKVLQLRENDFLSQDFKDEIKAVLENKKRLERRINDEKESIKTLMSQCSSDNEKLEYESQAKINEIEELAKLESKADQNIRLHENHMQNLKTDRESQKKLMLEKIKKLDEAMPDVGLLQQELTQLKELKKKQELDLKKLIRKTEDSFIKLREEVMGHFQQLNELRTRVFDHMAERLSEVDTEEEKIYNELQQLSPIGDMKKD